MVVDSFDFIVFRVKSRIIIQMDANLYDKNATMKGKGEMLSFELVF